TAIADPTRDRMIVFGGSLNSTLLNDTWTLSLGETPAWTPLATSGPLPAARSGHTAIYDPVRDRMIVYGGSDGTYLGDVWALSLSGSPTWAPITPAGPAPAARQGHTAIYDPVRDRMIIFGGFAPGLSSEAWALSLSGAPAWTLISASGAASFAY